MAFVLLAPALFGGGEGGQGAQRTGGSPSAQEAQYASAPETFTRQNYGVLAANPEEHEGAEVDITGQLLDGPENQGDVAAFQMFVDPVHSEWNTLVRAEARPLVLGLRSDDYVRVHGTVAGEFEGENAFGGTVTAVGVDADEVERVEAVEAIDPTQKTVMVRQSRTSPEGFSVTLERLEFGRKHTRAFVVVRNNGQKGARLDLDRSKIVQGGDRIGQTDPYDYNLPKPKPGIKPGEQSEGAIIFRHADPSEALQVSFAWESGGYLAKTPAPIVFEASP